MKININTNHIRICKLLGYTSYKTADFIAEFLNMDKQNVNLYIKQIYFFCNPKENKTTTTNMIEYISKDESILEQLKQNQCFTRDNRVFYIIVLLLRDRYINLNNLSNILGVSRRVLSNDLLLVKGHLESYKLNINSSNAKGITLSGSEYNLKMASFSYLYKIFVEFDDLPNLITNNYTDFFPDQFHIKLNSDIDKFILEYNFDFFSQNKNILKAFFVIYGNLANPDEITIHSLPFDTFKHKFKNIIQTSKLKSCYNLLQKSFIGDISLKHLNLFILVLKFCNGIFKQNILPLSKEINVIKSLVFKELSFIIQKDNFLERLVNKLHIVSLNNNPLPVCDLNFLNFNLPEKDRLNCVDLFFTFRKMYKNVQFSNIIFLYIWSSYEKNMHKVKTAIVVFDNIPTFLFPIIKNKFLIKENIKILNFIKINELNKCLSDKSVNCIITFENLSNLSKYPFIKNYSISVL
ncbi:MAG: hypothetical protein ACRC5G_04890 [Cetobacterium sp.]